MVSPRWFWVATSLLILNICGVFAAGVWRHATADDLPAETASKNTAENTAEKAVEKTVEKTLPQSVRAATFSDIDSPAVTKSLDQLAVPADLPEVPSLADAEALNRDPIFQEFRKFFSGESETLNTAPPLGRSSLPTSSNGISQGNENAAYLTALEQRFENAEQLCSAARGITREAARLALSGKSEPSRELVKMATQLRDVAAKLLVSEL